MKWPWKEFADDPLGYCRSFLIVVAMFMLLLDDFGNENRRADVGCKIEIAI